MDNINIKDLYINLNEIRLNNTLDNKYKEYLTDILKSSNTVFRQNTIELLKVIKNTYKELDEKITWIIYGIEQIMDANNKIYNQKKLVQERIDYLNSEMKKRNPNMKELKIREHNPFQSLNDMKTYLQQLESDYRNIGLIINKIKNEGKEQKSVVENKEENNVTPVTPKKEEVKVVNEEPKKEVIKEEKVNSNDDSKNIINNLINPNSTALNKVFKQYKDFKDDLDIEIELNNNELTIVFKNRNNDSKEVVKTIAVYTNINQVNDLLFQVIANYAKSSITKEEQLNDKVYKNISEDNDTLTLKNFNKTSVEVIKEYIKNLQAKNKDKEELELAKIASDDEYLDDDDEDSDDRFTRYNSLGKVGPKILAMTVLVLLITISVFIATGIFNLLK